MDAEAELEEQAAAGDGAAQFELGVMLLSGPRAVVDGARGVALVNSAAAGGHAAAIAMTAVFHAMGVARVQSWDAALDRLEAAAQRGSESAREQLLILARHEDGLPTAVDPSEQFWRGLRSTIHVDELLRSSERIVMSDAPRVRTIKAFASVAECRWLVSRARDRLQRAAVVDKQTGTLTYQAERSNRAVEFQLPDMDVVLELIRARISTATSIPVPVFEPTQVLHYRVGEEFRPHFDYLDPNNPAYRDQLRFGQRIATFLIYLNNEFEGGETDFPKAGIRYSGNVGDAIFWANVDAAGQPEPMSLHAGRPPTKGEKWILSQWIRDRSPAYTS